MVEFNNFKKNNYKYLDEIDEGLNFYLEFKSERKYWTTKGKGSKSYVIRRIDLLRDNLLELKKQIKED